MKSEFLPTDNRGGGGFHESNEARRRSKGEKKCIAAEKRSERRRGRPIANGFCGFLARPRACGAVCVRMYGTYTYVRTYVQRARVYTLRNGRVSKRERDKRGRARARARVRATTYRRASNCRAAENRCPFHALHALDHRRLSN